MKNQTHNIFISRREDESDALIITMFGEYWKNFAYFGAPHAESFTKWPVYYKSVNVGWILK